MRIYLSSSLFLSFLLLSCSSEINYAPVTDINSYDSIPSSGIHRVKHGETVYEIAWRYGLDYRELAKRNHINGAIYSGQELLLKDMKKQLTIVLDQRNQSAAIEQQKKISIDLPNEDQVANANHPSWIKPAKGEVIQGFSAANKGIDIAGVSGEPVLATAKGQVVYCGDGLRRLGNLIILKHDNVYLSAYAHNSKVFVTEGEWVRQGQKIAEMGNTGTNKVILHFEIRRAGKPIEPIFMR